MQNSRARHLKIKYELQMAGSSFNEVARELGLSHSTILAVSNNRTKSRRVQAAIAAKIGVHPAQLWPEYYPGEGEAFMPG